MSFWLHLLWANTHILHAYAQVLTHARGSSLKPNTNASRPFCLIFCYSYQCSDGGWNDNKWVPLEELVAIKGNREPQYTTPVSLAKLKQITPTSIAYYGANDNNLFIIRIFIHLFDHGWHPVFIFPPIASFPVCKHDRWWFESWRSTGFHIFEKINLRMEQVIVIYVIPEEFPLQKE